jgi:hypothetical protein
MKCAFGITHDNILRVNACLDNHVRNADIGCASPHHRNLYRIYALADNLECIDETCKGDGSRPLLVIMPDRDAALPAERVKDAETFRLGNVLKVDAAEAGLEEFHRLDEDIRVFCVKADWEGVHAAQIFEKEGLSFHDRNARFSADVSQTQNAGAIRYDSHHVSLIRVLKDLFRVLLDVFTGGGDAGGVPDGKIIDIPDNALRGHTNLSPVKRVQSHGILGWFFRLRQKFLFGYVAGHKKASLKKLSFLFFKDYENIAKTGQKNCPYLN